MIRAWHFLYEGHKLRDGRTTFSQRAVLAEKYPQGGRR